MRLDLEIETSQRARVLVMLYVPFVLGVAVAGRVNWQVLLLLLSTTAMFISLLLAAGADLRRQL